MADIEYHFNAKLGTEFEFGNIVGEPVAAVGKNMGSDLSYFLAHADVSRIFFMARDDYFIDALERFDDFLSVDCRHKDRLAFDIKPVVIVHDYHKYIAQLLCLLHVAYMTNVNWVKTSADHDDFLGRNSF